MFFFFFWWTWNRNCDNTWTFLLRKPQGLFQARLNFIPPSTRYRYFCSCFPQCLNTTATFKYAKTLSPADPIYAFIRHGSSIPWITLHSWYTILILNDWFNVSFICIWKEHRMPLFIKYELWPVEYQSTFSQDGWIHTNDNVLDMILIIKWWFKKSLCFLYFFCLSVCFWLWF